jgi:prepilin-type N-terminal cleavage/methylation domain-containing protein
MHRMTFDQEGGFTLIELLVAMVISLLVLFAALTTLDNFTSESARQTRITDANGQVRATVDRVVADLRQAAVIVRADPNDLVYSVKDSASVTRAERICLASTGDLYGAESTTSTTPDTACPTSAGGWSGGKIATLRSTNTAASPIFSYDSVTPSSVKSVGLTFSLDAAGSGRSAGSTLRASADVRRASGTLPITDGDIGATCSNANPILTLNVGGLAALGPLSVTYASTGGVALGSGLGPVTIPTGITTVVATITDAAGITQTVSKSVTCS